MRIAFVGCGYVFDIYMRTRWAHSELEICGVYDIDLPRSAVVARHYGLRVYESYAELLADGAGEVVVNLTNVKSHYDVTKQALEAGKHVYTEKPISLELEQTRELFDLAQERGLIFVAAPCNIYSDAVNTVWRAVRDGAIGKPVLIYAELDDNPAHLMRLEQVQSPTGAPFPYVEELQEGCTAEHIGYHLVWLCAMFGPVLSLSGFSKHLVEHKTDTPLDPADTPDFSVGCLNFANGVAARITCSWVAPRDHRFRIIGEEGELSVDNVFHDQSPVHLERFTPVGLTARKAYSIRTHPALGRVFGVGGRRLPLVRRWKSHAVEAERGVGRSPKHRLVSWLRRREIYAQDKFLGIAETVRAIREGRAQPLPPDFLMHLNELTLLIQSAGPRGLAAAPSTSFAPIEQLPDTVGTTRDYRASYRQRPLERTMTGIIEILHKR